MPIVLAHRECSDSIRLSTRMHSRLVWKKEKELGQTLYAALDSRMSWAKALALKIQWLAHLESLVVRADCDATVSSMWVDRRLPDNAFACYIAALSLIYRMNMGVCSADAHLFPRLALGLRSRIA